MAGNNISDFTGCYDLSNPITVIRELPSSCTASASDITLADGTTETTIIVDGIGDPLDVVLTGTSTGPNFGWVITDDANNILALPPAPPFDLDPAGPGTCLIWYVRYENDFAGAMAGNNISDLTGCFDLSNPITVVRELPSTGGGDCTSTSNLALNGTATESSEQFGVTGSRAIDGNTDGDFWNGNSVALTAWEPQPWIEVDLGQISNIESFNLYNRTDCCSGFLNNYHIFVSDVPFTSTDLIATQAQAGVLDLFETAVVGTPTTVIAPPNTTGRYVRIQLKGTSFLGLAELEIIGCVGGGGPCPAAGTPCDDGDASTENDVEDGSCGCAGTPIPCPAAGTACDDGNPNTVDDEEDGNCNCSGTPIVVYDCPALSANIGDTCDDGDANTENDIVTANCDCTGTPISTGGACTSTFNLALNGTASQSGTLNVAGFNGVAANAIDGNTDGVIFDGSPGDASVTATNFVNEPWWQVDLGASYFIETVNAFNRTDGADKTNDAWILVSNTPFTSNDLAGARAQADYEMFFPGLLGSPSVAMPNINGQYVRIQMEGSGYLVLAEVEVIGCTATQQFATPNLLNFNVVKDGRASKVDWYMLKDVNVDYYDVEVSTDGNDFQLLEVVEACLLYTSPSPRDQRGSRMPSSA